MHSPTHMHTIYAHSLVSLAFHVLSFKSTDSCCIDCRICCGFSHPPVILLLSTCVLCLTELCLGVLSRQAHKPPEPLQSTHSPLLKSGPCRHCGSLFSCTEVQLSAGREMFSFAANSSSQLTFKNLICC